MCVVLRHGVRAFDLTTLARCGARARTRGGAPCKRYGTLRNGRCRLHGGRSTGPRAAARLALGRRSHRHGFFAGDRLRWRRAAMAMFARLGKVLAAADPTLPVWQTWRGPARPGRPPPSGPRENTA